MELPHDNDQGIALKFLKYQMFTLWANDNDIVNHKLLSSVIVLTKLRLVYVWK